MSRSRKLSIWVLGLIAVYGLAVLFRFNHVHSESGEWRDRPTAQPPLLHYHGQSYNRSATAESRRTHFIRHTSALGGGIVLAPKQDPNPTMLQVEYKGVYVDYQRAGA